MMNYLWGSMILLGILWAFFSGRMDAVSDAALTGAEDAVGLCITMLGVMCMWTGLMEIARAAGIVEKLSRGISPAMQKLFPGVPPGSKAEEYISLNVIANVLGLGWAATPAGLKAMKELDVLREKRGLPKRSATKDMCNFLIFNISSLQLIPVNLIAYRSQYGSENSTGIIAPAILATLCSTLAAVVFILLVNRFYKEGGDA